MCRWRSIKIEKKKTITIRSAQLFLLSIPLFTTVNVHYIYVCCVSKLWKYRDLFIKTLKIQGLVYQNLKKYRDLCIKTWKNTGTCVSKLWKYRDFGVDTKTVSRQKKSISLLKYFSLLITAAKYLLKSLFLHVICLELRILVHPPSTPFCVANSLNPTWAALLSHLNPAPPSLTTTCPGRSVAGGF